MNPQEVIEAAIADGAFPGASWAFGSADRIETGSAGRHTYDDDSPEVKSDSIYDIASLTKVVATTSTAMLLSQMDELDIEKPVQFYLPEFTGAGKEDVTVLNLLLHNSGLPPHREYWKEFPSLLQAWSGIPQEELVYKPGSETQYSCVGFIILSMVLESILNGGGTVQGLKEFEVFTELSVLCRLQMGHSTFRPGPFTRRLCVPTEVVEDGFLRQGLIKGEVHDENAFFLGGVAGNSGLFSTAADLARFAQCLLRGGDGIFQEGFLKVWTAREDESSTRALGWDTKAEFGSSAGDLFGPNSFGHTGFTGTSIWIDPVAGAFGVLVSNRVNPTRENQKITTVRPRFYNAVYNSIKA
ncbi:MAG: serine hydrolase [Armatimonadetes bacterium]|nr:serine hydrolase [Armatimonadota bacterium]